MFAALIPDPCDKCHGDRCDKPYGVDTKGFSSMHPYTAPDMVVRWPACPRKWDILRRWGTDLVRLDDVVQWAWETRLHLDPLQPYGGARLVREWLRTKDLPSRLLEARHYEENKRGKV